MDRTQPSPDPELDHELPNEAQEQTTPETPGLILNYTTSPTLRALDPSQLPDPRTVCMRCEWGMWMQSGTGLACYCKIQHRMAWTVAEPVQLLNCDGQQTKS
jgi:hypothetical protein